MTELIQRIVIVCVDCWAKRNTGRPQPNPIEWPRTCSDCGYTKEQCVMMLDEAHRQILKDIAASLSMPEDIVNDAEHSNYGASARQTPDTLTERQGEE